MAKIKPSLINISGKFNDVVLVQGKKDNRYVRKAVEKGTKADEPALKRQYTRTKYLNALASEINTIVTTHVGGFKPSQFYQNVQSRFRKEPLNNRFLLLMQLKGMEVDPKFPLSRLGVQDVSVRVLKNKFVVTIDVKQHPDAGRHKANCYCYEVLLVMWDKTNKPAKHVLLSSAWVDMGGGWPEFEFSFPRPAGMVHWMLGLRQRLGVNKEVLTAQRTEGMQVVDVGSLEERDWGLVRKREEEVGRQQRKVSGVKEVEVVRVEAKMVRSART